MTVQHEPHRTWRSTVAVTLAALLTSVMLLGGCAPSPYDLAQQKSTTISADVRKVVDKLILDANKIASERDGKVYVDTKEFERVVVFAPKPDSHITMEYFTAAVPKGSIIKKWKDRFALAQELSWRYSYAEITKIDQQISPPYFTANPHFSPVE